MKIQVFSTYGAYIVVSVLIILANATKSMKNSTEEFHKSHGHRSKRFIYYNVDSNLDVGFLCVVPITIVLPPMSNLFNKWRRRRSIDTSNMESFEDHHIHQPNLDRLALYFDMLDIPEHHCQLRTLCEVSADPSKYYPLSNMFHSQIIPTNDFMVGQNQTNSKSLIKLYREAVESGMAEGHLGCDHKYSPMCKYSVDKLINPVPLRIFNGLRTTLGLKMVDDVIL